MDKEAAVQIYNGIYSAMERETFESILMRWMNLQPIIQSEMSEKERYCILMHIYGI